MHKQKLGHEALDNRRRRLIARRIREGYSRRPVDRKRMFEHLKAEIKGLDLWPQLTPEEARFTLQSLVDGAVSEEIAIVESDYYFRDRQREERPKSRRKKG